MLNVIINLFTGRKEEPIQVQAEDARNIHPGQQTQTRKPNARRKSQNANKGVAVSKGAIPGSRFEHTEP